jgi:cytochrome c-type biogenesis protein CcsB
MKNTTKSLPVFILSGLMLAACFSGPVSAQVDTHQWGLLAVQDNGRTKPMTAFARESLIRLSGQKTVTFENRKVEANTWMLSMMLEDTAWETVPMILIAYRPLVEELGLDPSRKRFSFAELVELPGLREKITEAHRLRSAEAPVARSQTEAELVGVRMSLFENIRRGVLMKIVPPPSPAVSEAMWLTPPEALEAYGREATLEMTETLQNTAVSYQQGDAKAFTEACEQLRKSIRELRPNVYPKKWMLDLENAYYQWRPFSIALAGYVLAFVVLILTVTSQVKSSTLVKAGVALASTALLVHIVGMVVRSLIAGRPPVTNMYESVIWVSFGVISLGLIFGWKFRSLMCLLAALPVSALCLVLVQQMPIAMPERLDPLVPVLRSNFWLTTHVLTITMSYAAFALAMGLGHIALVRYLKNPAGIQADQTFHLWLYRSLQVGVLLLAVGTILGGVWANYSWGRFWGWDPKETWALIALLCYIVVLHGKIAGWWDDFGLAIGSVISFLAVLMAWYGVNFILGAGLHSYGFGVGGEAYVVGYVLLELIFIGIVILRVRFR